MSNRLDDRRHSAQEESADREARQHFTQQLNQFVISREAVDELERNLVVAALAANIAAARLTPPAKVIQADDGMQWHKSLDLMPNFFLCHRPVTGGAEYAVLEFFPLRFTHEIWNRSWNAVEVLQSFVQAQRHSLQLWTEDMTEQIKQFLAKKNSGHDMSRAADDFMHQFTQAVSRSLSTLPGPVPRRDARI